MKYEIESVLLLKNGKTVYIFSIDEHSKTYWVAETDDGNNTYQIQEDDILKQIMKI